jgi:hypothetical protein
LVKPWRIEVRGWVDRQFLGSGPTTVAAAGSIAASVGNLAPEGLAIFDVLRLVAYPPS